MYSLFLVENGSDNAQTIIQDNLHNPRRVVFVVLRKLL